MNPEFETLNLQIMNHRERLAALSKERSDIHLQLLGLQKQAIRALLRGSTWEIRGVHKPGIWLVDPKDATSLWDSVGDVRGHHCVNLLKPSTDEDATPRVDVERRGKNIELQILSPRDVTLWPTVLEQLTALYEFQYTIQRKREKRPLGPKPGELFLTEMGARLGRGDHW